MRGMKHVVCCLAVIVVLCFSAARPATAELIVNGGFEPEISRAGLKGGTCKTPTSLMPPTPARMPQI